MRAVLAAGRQRREKRTERMLYRNRMNARAHAQQARAGALDNGKRTAEPPATGVIADMLKRQRDRKSDNMGPDEHDKRH